MNIARDLLLNTARGTSLGLKHANGINSNHNRSIATMSMSDS